MAVSLYADPAVGMERPWAEAPEFAVDGAASAASPTALDEAEAWFKDSKMMEAPVYKTDEFRIK